VVQVWNLFSSVEHDFVSTAFFSHKCHGEHRGQVQTGDHDTRLATIVLCHGEP
jgi:hypothetical protein